MDPPAWGSCWQSAQIPQPFGSQPNAQIFAKPRLFEPNASAKRPKWRRLLIVPDPSAQITENALMQARSAGVLGASVKQLISTLSFLVAGGLRTQHCCSRRPSQSRRLVDMFALTFRFTRFPFPIVTIRYDAPWKTRILIQRARTRPNCSEFLKQLERQSTSWSGVFSEYFVDVSWMA